jgi:methylmalonyl-CoA mutase N-terminal domain/subunit
MEPRSTERGREAWRQALEKATLRDVDVDTYSGLPVETAYGADDGLYPGQWPYTRGPYASMYRSKLWTTNRLPRSFASGRRPRSCS